MRKVESCAGSMIDLAAIESAGAVPPKMTSWPIARRASLSTGPGPGDFIVLLKKWDTTIAPPSTDPRAVIGDRKWYPVGL